MRSNFLVVAFALYLADGHCGIIAEKELADGKTGRGGRGKGVKYGGGGRRSEVDGKEAGSERALSMLEANAAADAPGPSPIVKRKRCCPSSVFYKPESPYAYDLEPIMGIRAPAGIQRRDLQSTINKRFCTTCLTRPQCKLHQKCEQCLKWCPPEDIPSITTEKLIAPIPTTPSATTSIQTTPVAPATTIETPVLGSSLQKIESRFGGASRDPHMKRIHTIATLRSGDLKTAICKLLGVVDTSDIDTVVVWVTTRSNQPPRFDPEYQKSVSPQAEKLTYKLNEELDKALREKKMQYGRNYLTNEEIIQVMNSVPIDIRERKEENSKQRSNLSEDILPVYPIDPNGLESDIPRILNPGVIEDAPDMRLLGAKEDKVIESRLSDIASATTTGEIESSKNTRTEEEMTGSDISQKTEMETVGVTPTVTTSTKETTGQDLIIPTSTKETLIVSPNLSDSDEDEGLVTTTEDQDVELGVTQEQIEARTEEIITDDNLRTSSLKHKILHKQPGKLHGGILHHPKKSRTNEESNESVVGAAEEETQENIATQQTPTENLIDRLGTSKLIQKLKNKNADKIQGGYKSGPQLYSRANSMEKDNVVGATEGVPNIENVTPTQSSEEEKPLPEESTIPTNDLNATSSPPPDDRVAIQNTFEGEVIGNTGDSDDIPDTDTNTVGSPIVEEASEEIEQPIPLKARTNALLDKIKQRLEHKKKAPLPSASYVDYREAEDKIGSTQGDESGGVKAKSMEDTKTIVQDTGPESVPSVDIPADNDDQEPVKVTLADQDLQSSSGVIDDFQKAKEVLKDVESLVETIRKDTNIVSGSGLLGNQQETGSQEPKNEIKQETTFAPVSFVTEQETEAPQDSTLGSQPLEEIVEYGDIGRPVIKIPDYRSSEPVNVGSPLEENIPNSSNEIPQENMVGDQNVDNIAPKEFPSTSIHISPIGKEIPVRQSTTSEESALGEEKSSPLPEEENRIDVNTRGKFPGEPDNSGPPIWSNSFGEIIPTQQETALVSMQPKDIFFIGNGIKLPLQMVRKSDGAVHLSVDLDKMCSCKNATCPKNHTAIEETVGTILEKEAELKDQLAETDPEFSDPVGMGANNGRERSVNKRSVDQGLHLNKGSDLVEVKNGTETSAKNDSNTDIGEVSSLTPFLFKRMMDKKITELKSKISNIGRKNELLGSHLLFPQKGLKNLLNNIGREFNRGTKAQEDTLIRKLGQSEGEENMLKKVRGDEIYDESIPITNVHQFKKLEEDLEDDLDKFNEFVDQYTKDHEKVIGEEAKTFLKMHEDLTVKKQIDIMNTFIAWLKRVAVNKGGK